MAVTDCLKYKFEEDSYELESDCEIAGSQYVRFTSDRGIDSSRSVTFRIGRNSDSLLDMSKFFIKTKYRIVKDDDNPIGSSPTVYPLENHGINLWTSASVSLNNVPLPPSNDYAYTANLVNLIGATPEVRKTIMGPLTGFREPMSSSSKIGTDEWGTYDEAKQKCADSKTMTVYTRIYSDFIQSCSQLLPYDCDLTIVLNRSKDSFVLGVDPGDNHPTYKINIESVSLFIKKIYLSDPATARIRSSIQDGLMLQYQRLQTVVYPCPERSLTFSFYDLYHGIVPRKAFAFLVTQEAYFGSYRRNSMYLESADVSKVTFFSDGRAINPESYETSFKYHPKTGHTITESSMQRYTAQLENLPDDADEETRNTLKAIVGGGASDAMSPFAGLCRVVSSFSNPRELVGVEYPQFVDGSTIFAVSMDHSQRMTAMRGSFDMTIEFRTPLKEPHMVIVVGEYPKTIKLDQDKNVSEM